MGRILTALVAWLTGEGLAFVLSEGKSLVLLHVVGENSRLTCIAQARERQEQLIFYTLLPGRVPKEKRLAMAEYASRANTTVAIGSFELDFDEGLLAYRTSLEVEGVPLTPELIRPLFEHAITTTDRHFPGIMTLLFKDTSPVEALDRIEPYPLDEVIALANELLDE